MVDNALRHGAGDVALSAARDDGHVELHVRDGGPGFPDGFLPAAFERFSRVRLELPHPLSSSPHGDRGA